MGETGTDGWTEPEQAFEAMDDGIGRRTLLKAAAAIGGGAVAPSWMLSPGGAEATGTLGDRRGPRVLQPGEGRRVGRYVKSTPETIRWGYLPNAASKPVVYVDSGSVVTFDTVSHEGILEDQGRDPVGYFASRASARVTSCATRARSPRRGSSTTSPSTALTLSPAQSWFGALGLGTCSRSRWSD